MRAVTIMYDSLNRRFLPPYGAQGVIAPNFQRLAEHCVTFDNFYCGSMPCMPARRELHTGRYNFLMRSWSPLEPFDDSMPELLSRHKICTQFVSDHCHYWQDGGLTYHERYSCFDFIRGQEGDEWHARSAGYADMGGKRLTRRQDPINRGYTREGNCCHARCFAAAMDFLEHNVQEDNWYLHLEYFDPHEPFDCPDEYKRPYADEPLPAFDWPQYAPSEEQDPEKLRQAVVNYKACISMCDDYLGRVLDFFDAHDMWKDTMLIVNTDHGYLLGEHGYFAKNYMPCYEELVNLPFFLYDPRQPEAAGTRRRALAQTIDIPPTLLDFFHVDIPGSMQGRSLLPVVADDRTVHDAILFGYFGKHINVRDGRYVYMRAARDNSLLYEYTLMPTRLAAFFTREELKSAGDRLYTGFDYCGNIPMLKIPGNTGNVPNASHHQYDVHLQYGDLLFDLEADRVQEHNLRDDGELTRRMVQTMIALMKESDAPQEQYQRMGFAPEQYA